VARITKRSLRVPVITSAVCAAIWTLLWGIASFRAIEYNREDGFPELVPFSIALGVLFSVACLIEVFGVYAATTQRLPLVRMYTFGSIAASLIVIGAQIIIIVTDFLHKGKHIDSCVKFNTGADVYVSRGWWGETRRLEESEAKDWCNDRLRREIIADFAWLIVTSILAALFTSVVFSYYRQLLDPSFSRAPSNQIRMQAFTVYPPGAQPYGGYGNPYGGQPDYVPAYDSAKLPGYEGSGRQSPEKELGQPMPTNYAPPPGPPPQQVSAAAGGNATNPFERRAADP